MVNLIKRAGTLLDHLKETHPEIERALHYVPIVGIAVRLFEDQKIRKELVGLDPLAPLQEKIKLVDARNTLKVQGIKVCLVALAAGILLAATGLCAALGALVITVAIGLLLYYVGTLAWNALACYIASKGDHLVQHRTL